MNTRADKPVSSLAAYLLVGSGGIVTISPTTFVTLSIRPDQGGEPSRVAHPDRVPTSIKES